jgi:hypothetical protein
MTQSDQTKNYKIDIYCFSAKHAALRSKSKDWLLRNQNVSDSITKIFLWHCIKYKAPNSGTIKVNIIKNERDPSLFMSKLLLKFQNILRNTTQVIIRHRVKILFFIISSRKDWLLRNQNVSDSSDMSTCELLFQWASTIKFYQQLIDEERRIPFIFDDFHFCLPRVIGLDMMKNRIFTLCRMIQSLPLFSNAACLAREAIN